MRRILSTAALLSVLTSSGSGSASSEARLAPEVPEAPNVLIVLTDDQRVGTVAPLPQIRRWFRAGGVEYPNAIATTPVCCPSRATIMSGRYAHNHGVHDNRHPESFDEGTSLQRHLQDAGYRTGLIGKYLNNWDVSKDPAFLDDWAIYARGDLYRGAPWNVNGAVRTVPEYSTTFIRRRTLRFLEESEASDDQPWFVLVAPAAPHAPAVAEPRYRRARFEPWEGNPATREQDRSDKPEYVRARPPSRTLSGPMRKHLRALLSVDRLVGAVFERLRELGEGDTLAFFLSDNGFLLGEHGLVGKAVPYRASIGIPFFMRWPGRLPAGTDDPALAGTIDVAPTALDAAGVDVETDGRSLLQPTNRDAILSEFWYAGGPVPAWSSIRTPTVQYVEYEDEAGVVTFREYYDLIADPWQLRNLLGDRDATNDPPDTAALSARLAALRQCSGTSGPGACP